MYYRNLLTLSLLLACSAIQAQVSPGQFLVNGEFSFFNNHAANDRQVSSTFVDGNSIPAYNYTLDQYSSNTTFTPRVHYFLSEKWSVGLSFTLRRLVARRTIDEFNLEETSEYVAFNVSTRTQSIVSSYIPKLEVARHWQLNNRFAINLTGVFSWQWSTTKVVGIPGQPLVSVAELEADEVSEDGLTISLKNQTENATTAKEQYWNAQIFPQLRFAITTRFGLTANVGNLALRQQVKDGEEDFVRTRPNLSVGLNPGTWRLGGYFLIGGGERE